MKNERAAQGNPILWNLIFYKLNVREKQTKQKGMKKIINYRLLVTAQCCQVEYVLQLNPSLQLRCTRNILIEGDTDNQKKSAGFVTTTF